MPGLSLRPARRRSSPPPSFFVSEEGLNEWNRLNGIEPPEEEEDPRSVAGRRLPRLQVDQNPVEQYSF